MASITADQIISILQGGSYPYPLHYFKYKQRFPLDASVEISRAQPDSYVEDVVKTERNFAFEIKFIKRFTSLPDQEISNIASIEDEMSRVLKAFDYQGQGKIFLDSFGWSRSETNFNNVHGNISTIRLGIKDVTSTDGSGYVGAYNILELNSDTTPVQIQILNSNFRDGRGIILHADDYGLMAGDPTNYNPGDFTVTYENTATIQPLINTLTKNGANIKCKFINGSTTYQYLLLVGDTVKSGGYSDVERATTRFVVNGTW